jgi:high affinity Mn2+ porin
VSVKGAAWGRAEDTFGLAGVLNGISHAEQDFFAAGGKGIEGGDGALSYDLEKTVEIYYSCKLIDHVFLTPDFQFVSTPAFNRDRGPVAIFGLRLHLEW